MLSPSSSTRTFGRNLILRRTNLFVGSRPFFPQNLKSVAKKMPLGCVSPQIGAVFVRKLESPKDTSSSTAPTQQISGFGWNIVSSLEIIDWLNLVLTDHSFNQQIVLFVIKSSRRFYEKYRMKGTSRFFKTRKPLHKKPLMQIHGSFLVYKFSLFQQLQLKYSPIKLFLSKYIYIYIYIYANLCSFVSCCL